MIHYIRQGRVMELGLNFCLAPGGFVVWWAWYNYHRHEGPAYRFRLRLHMKPRIIWSVSRWNVIHEHLSLHDLVPVNREWLQDTNAAWRDQLRRDKASVQFGP